MASYWIVTVALKLLVLIATGSSTDNEGPSQQMCLSTAELDNAQLTLKVKNLEKMLADSDKLVQDLQGKEKLLSKMMLTKEQRLQEAQMLAEQLKIKKQLEEFNSTKDWATLRRGLEALLDEDSAAYKQLQSLKYEEKWPMWYVGINGYQELAAVLVLGGQEFEAQDVDGGTILQGAALKGRVEMVEMLLDHGADMESVSGVYCRTAIIYATENHRNEVVTLLAQRGANLNRGNCDGDTSLHWAAWDGYMDMVKSLVEAGADTTATNNKGHTPLEHCSRKGRTEIEQYLSQFPH